jgi:RimJ/RimL family protein N-acetyltransferase
VLSPKYPIRTARLAIRPWRSDELDVYHALRRDPSVTRYLYSEPLSRDEAAAKLAGLQSTITEPGTGMVVAVEIAATGAVVGDVNLFWTSDVHRQAEIGYVLLPVHHGHGYATEAASAMVDLAFAGLGAHRVTAQLDARNTASAAVLERLGMRHEAHLVENEFVKGEWTDEAIYAVLDREWAARATPGGG